MLFSSAILMIFETLAKMQIFFFAKKWCSNLYKSVKINGDTIYKAKTEIYDSRA